MGIPLYQCCVFIENHGDQGTAADCIRFHILSCDLDGAAVAQKVSTLKLFSNILERLGICGQRAVL